MWSLDNRRLYALQLAAMDIWPRLCRVRCLSRERLPRHKFKTQYRALIYLCGLVCGWYLEDHPRTCKWLGSPPLVTPIFLSHEKAIWKGNNPIIRGLTNHGY